MVRDSGCMVVVNRVCALFIWYRVCTGVRDMVHERHGGCVVYGGCVVSCVLGGRELAVSG